jgi:carbonic anhydrase
MKIHKPGELITDAQTALIMLKEGNERFLNGELIAKETYRADREILNDIQNPFAAILTCSDSRVAPEIFFDQKLGDIFVVRNAGNIADATTLGSMEYAVEYLKTKLIVVCGHSKCGAVTAAFSREELSPNMNHIVSHIHPAVRLGGDIEEVIFYNIGIMVAHIKSNKIIINNEVMVAGAFYDVHTGVVKWL